MPQLLLEIFSEEIPARMQAKAEADLGAAVNELKIEIRGLQIRSGIWGAIAGLIPAGLAIVYVVLGQ